MQRDFQLIINSFIVWLFVRGSRNLALKEAGGIK